MERRGETDTPDLYRNGMNLEGLCFPNFVSNLTLLFCFSKTYIYYFFSVDGKQLLPPVKAKTKMYERNSSVGKNGKLSWCPDSGTGCGGKCWAGV